MLKCLPNRADPLNEVMANVEQLQTRERHRIVGRERAGTAVRLAKFRSRQPRMSRNQCRLAAKESVPGLGVCPGGDLTGRQSKELIT